MATQTPIIDSPLIREIEEEINSLFDQLIERARARRDQLITQLLEIWGIYESQMQKRKNTIRDIEKMRDRMEITSIKDNTAAEIKKLSVQDLEERIRSLRKKIEPPNLIFSGYLPIEFLEQVDSIGEIFESSESESQPTKKLNAIDYKVKKKAKLTIGTKGARRGQFNRPSRIYIDDRTKRLYVPDSDNKRIQILNTNGEYIAQFGQEEMTFPVSVTTDQNYVYVSDNSQDCILRYRLSNLAFVNSQTRTSGGFHGFLKLPRGIALSSDNEVLVADNNNRICVFDCELNYICEFGRSYLVCPQSIQVQCDQIFVLDCGNPCLHIFTSKGEKTSSMITRGFLRQVKDGISFCFDHEGNILIADNAAKRLKVFSPEGDAIHTIGGGTIVTEDIGFCWGVAVSGNKIFVAGRIDHNHFVKIF